MFNNRQTLPNPRECFNGIITLFRPFFFLFFTWDIFSARGILLVSAARGAAGIGGGRGGTAGKKSGKKRGKEAVDGEGWGVGVVRFSFSRMGFFPHPADGGMKPGGKDGEREKERREKRRM